MLRTLYSRLLIAFGLLVVAPLAAESVLLYTQTRVVMEKQAADLQDELAERVASEFQNFIFHHVQALQQIIRVRGLATMPQDQAEYLLEGLLAFGNQFEELVLLNMDGNEQVVVHRYRLVVSSDLNSRAGDPVFQQVRKNRKSFFSQVFFQNETGEPLIQIGEPVFRVGDGRMQAVLMAKLRLKDIWDLLAAIPSQSGQTVYILDNRNQVVAHPDPSVVLRGTSLDTPESAKPLGLDGERVIRAAKPLNLGNQQFTVVAERPRRLALELAWDNLRLLAILGLFALSMIVVLIFLMVRQFIRPVRHLMHTARAIEEGDLKRRTALVRKDEVGELSRAFDRMTQRLSQSMESLEREVAERVRTEEELRSTNQRLALHMENTPLGVIEWDAEFRITKWNPAAGDILGYREDEVLGEKGDFLFRPGQDREMIRRYWSGLLDGKGEKHGQVEMIAKNGDSKKCELYNTILRDTDGRVIGLASLLQDISRRVFLEQQLRQAQKMEAIGTLAGGIAHDFNNILAAIIGYSELAMDTLDQGNTVQDEIGQIMKAADRAKMLIQQILAFSRKTTLEMRPLDINRVIVDSVKIIRATIPKMISLEVKSEVKGGVVNGDPNQLSQVFLNLASNAKDAMPGGGRLTIETKRVSIDGIFGQSPPGVGPGDYVRISVSDMGLGMDQGTLEHIFEPFYTTKEVGRGTGLGLASVYGIVKGHKGHIVCQSKQGEGTVFQIFLPALDLPTRQEVDWEEDVSADLRGSEKILIVDDEESIRRISERVLQRAGYAVRTAASGEQGLELYRANPQEVDLVILDLNMPGMGGFRTLEEMRSINPGVKVVIASGYAASGKVKELLGQGALGYVTKPFMKKDLLAAVRQTLGG